MQGVCIAILTDAEFLHMVVSRHTEAIMLRTHFDDSRFDKELLGGTHGAHGVAGASGVIYQVKQPAQEKFQEKTRFSCALEVERAYNDCTLSPQPRAWPNSAACNGLSPSSTLHSECPRCEDGIAFNGNDPAGGVRCDICDGTGVLERCCALCGEYGATDWIGREVFHAGCAEEVLADMHRVLERVA
jgi:hypothetical protein